MPIEYPIKKKYRVSGNYGHRSRNSGTGGFNGLDRKQRRKLPPAQAAIQRELQAKGGEPTLVVNPKGKRKMRRLKK